MRLKDLKKMPIVELNKLASELGIENANAMHRHDLMFAILKAISSYGAPAWKRIIHISEQSALSRVYSGVFVLSIKYG